MNNEAKRPSTELDAQFRREARIGGAVIVVALLGFVAVAYLRISGRLDRETWVGEIPPPASNFEQIGSPPALVDRGGGSPVNDESPTGPRQTQIEPRIESQREAENSESTPSGRPAPIASSGGGQLALSGPEHSRPPQTPLTQAIPPYDRLTQLRGEEPAIQPPARPLLPDAKSSQAPALSSAVARPLQPAAMTESSLANGLRRVLPPAPHLGLPSPPTWPTSQQPAGVIPIRPPHRNPDSTATLPSGFDQRHVSALLGGPEGEPPLRDRRMYITVEGDTLFTIAAELLGQASRFVELLELNRAILPTGAGSSTQLPAGLPLHLPAME